MGGVLLIAVWGCGMKKVKDKGEGIKKQSTRRALTVKYEGVFDVRVKKKTMETC